MVSMRILRFLLVVLVGVVVVVVVFRGGFSFGFQKASTESPKAETLTLIKPSKNPIKPSKLSGKAL